MEKKISKTVVWCFYPFVELEVANKINFDLFPNCVIKKEYYHKRNINKEDINIVIVDYFFHERTNRAPEDLSWADLVIHYTTEVLFGPWNEYKKLIEEKINNKNFISVCNGVVDMDMYPTDRVYVNAQSFFTGVAHHCVIEPIGKMTIVGHKKKLFDVLLGKNDGRRNKVFDLFCKHNMIGESFINFYNERMIENHSTRFQIYRSPELDEYEDPRVISATLLSTNQVEGLENGISMSHSIPKKIYENSWYSVVAETNSGTTFITEKTTKCLLAGRIFVMFAEQDTLKKLKEYGYQTFDGLIDESYDNEVSQDKRFEMAFEQLITLSKANHNLSYEMMHDRLVHNQQLCLNHTKRLENLRNFLNMHIKL